jgi:hypothetical protein
MQKYTKQHFSHYYLFKEAVISPTYIILNAAVLSTYLDITAWHILRLQMVLVIVWENPVMDLTIIQSP